MGSRSFSKAGPQIPHLVPRRRGGLAGESRDLRMDVEEAFENLEGEVDSYLIVEGEGSVVRQGKMKMNFTGAGVEVTPDLGDPTKVNVSVRGGGGGSGNVQVSATYADYPGPVSLGVLNAGKTVERVTLEILTPFDGGVQIIVGDEVARGRLMPADANAPSVLGMYVAESNYLYGGDTSVYLYFVGVTPPTTGALRVVVYFS